MRLLLLADSGSAVSDHLLHTAIVADIDQFSDEELRLCPGIFQWNVPKAYELRINVLGSHVIAVKIASQGVEARRTDWRSARPAELALEPYELPADIRTRCRNLLDRLGVVFGIIDMIVTPEGDYVFLEVNEMGQFLWIEAANPEIRLLDDFCSFLMFGPAGYRGEIKDPPISYIDLISDDALSSEFRCQRDTVRQPDCNIEWIDLLV